MVVRENGLGYILKNGIENSYYTDYEDDKENSYYFLEYTDDRSVFNFFYITYLTMTLEGLLTEEEEGDFLARSVCSVDYGIEKNKLIEFILGLNVFKSREIDSMDEVYLYLNQFRVHPIIMAHPEFAYKNCFRSGHGFIFYESDSTGRVFDYDADSEENPGLDRVFMLDLNKDYGNTDYPSCAVQVGDIGDVIIPMDDTESLYVYFTDRYTHILVYSLVKRKIVRVFEGTYITRWHNKIIIENENRLYCISGVSVKKIYTLGKFEIAESYNPKTLYYPGKISIKPLLRGCVIPYNIDYEGIFIEEFHEEFHEVKRFLIETSESAGKYVWDSFIESETIANRLSGFFGDWKLKDDKCSVNNILEVFEKNKSDGEEFYNRTTTFRKFIRLLGEYYDKDEDISDILLKLRRHSIYLEQEYWNETIRKVYKKDKDFINNLRQLSGDIVDADKYAIIDFEHRKFLPTKYMEGVLKYPAMECIDKFLDEIDTVSIRGEIKVQPVLPDERLERLMRNFLFK